MAVYPESATATLGQLSDVSGPVGPNYAVDVSITGIFVATVALERFVSATQTWDVIASYTGPIADTVLVASRRCLIRLVCTAYTSGSVSATITACDADEDAVGLPFGSEAASSMFRGTGVTASALFTPTAAAYGAGDIIDASKELAFTYADGTAIPAGSLIRILSSVIKIDVTAVPSGMTSYTGRLYSATQPSAQADNDAWTLVSGDLSVYCGPISLGTPVDEGSCLYIKGIGIDTDIKLTTSSLWMRLVTDGAHTATAIARQISLYGIVL